MMENATATLVLVAAIALHLYHAQKGARITVFASTVAVSVNLDILGLTAPFQSMLKRRQMQPLLRPNIRSLRFAQINALTMDFAWRENACASRDTMELIVRV